MPQGGPIPDARLHTDTLPPLHPPQGGLSKATKGLNLSEDVFAGMDATLRGLNIVHREYFQASPYVFICKGIAEEKHVNNCGPASRWALP